MEAEQIQTDDLNDQSSQFLTFILNDEEYGIEILKIQGIQGWGKVTPIPNTPEYILGVINIRGAIVPIIDLRGRFDLERIPVSPTTVIIIVKVVCNQKERVVGLVVDAVSEVYNVAGKEMQPPPNFGTSIDTNYVKGLVLVDDKMLTLLDIDCLVNTGVMEIVMDMDMDMDGDGDKDKEALVSD